MNALLYGAKDKKWERVEQIQQCTRPVIGPRLSLTELKTPDLAPLEFRQQTVHSIAASQILGGLIK